MFYTNIEVILIQIPINNIIIINENITLKYYKYI